MRQRYLGYALALASVSLMACSSDGRLSSNNDAGPTGRPPSRSVAETPAPPPPRVPAGNPAAAAVSQMTGRFVVTAAISDLYEVEAGHMAEMKSQAPEVKSFGAQMVRDHTQTTQQLMSVLMQEGLPPPPMTPDPRHAGMLQDLQNASGPDFDARYVQQQVAAHQEALMLMQSYASSGDNPQLRNFAQQTAPKIQMHLAMITDIARANQRLTRANP